MSVAISVDTAVRELVTPEGVPLRVRLAGRGDRAGAFVIDLLIIGAATAATVLTAYFGVSRSLGIAWAVSFLLLAMFVIRLFYFTFFELRWQGQTPGKRLLKLRVVDRRGGALRPDAVVVRNFMREVEVFLPLSLLVAGGATATEGLATVFTLGWVGVLTLMPLFNRERLRVGDMVAGTWVIEVPRRTLLPDLVLDRPASAETKGSQRTPAAFTREQLDVYGIFELQVLEDILRGDRQQTSRRDIEEIAERIHRKIGWTPPPDTTVNAEDFLADLYVALRAHLEQRMLFGERRESKHYARRPPGP